MRTQISQILEIREKCASLRMGSVNSEHLVGDKIVPMQKHDNITLIGMPGAGKSTLGVVLAKKLGYRFVDTDLLIQESEDMLLSEILEARGTEGFIACENELLANLSCARHVIATGGSAVYGTDAVANLKSLGTVVFLDLSLDEISRRLSPDLLDRGVVIHQGSTLADLYAERHPLYVQAADLTVKLDGLSTLESVEKLTAELALYLQA